MDHNNVVVIEYCEKMLTIILKQLATIFYVIVQILDVGLYRDVKSRVLFEKASIFNARGI